MPEDKHEKRRASSSSRRSTRRFHPEMLGPPPDARTSESGVLSLDAVDTLVYDLQEAEGVTAETREYFKKLLDHPCRKCPHLVLVHPHDEAGVRLPLGPLSAMPTPACVALPEATHDEAGELKLKYRETWKSCPLYGVRSVLDLCTALEKRIERLEKEGRSDRSL